MRSEGTSPRQPALHSESEPEGLRDSNWQVDTNSGAHHQPVDLESNSILDAGRKHPEHAGRKSPLGDIAHYPPQVVFIFGNEACERFSFYGMRSILVIYLTQHLLFADHAAESIFHTFAAGCYLMPLAGAYISDRFLGKLRTIAYLSMVYCLGHLILALWESQTGTFVGLAAVAVGSGGIKPCVSAFIGDQFPPEKQGLLQGAFAIFYGCINIGAFMGNLVTPLLLNQKGPRWAFAVPGIAMGVATVVLLLGDGGPTGKAKR
ncbi:hypothetical protein WJX73_005730 [Symbiochloris irregularis]|uniref:Major facilitator superfamily (MFS) profile domain-containing protein n=1 Tax=Symbiochloris irregularis TaxID=706552 RepID=A0AAW1P8Y8_9CHLO